MKKNIVIFLASAMILGICGCSSAQKNTPSETATNNNQPSSYSETASKHVNMNKVIGKELEDIEVMTENDEAVIGNYEVSIEDAKIIDYNEEKILIVSFDFDNDSSSDIAFDGAVAVDVTQNGSTLKGAVVTDVKGVDTNSAFETVKPGNDITLQKAYILEDEVSPIKVYAYRYGEPDKNAAEKTFNIQ